MSLALSRYLRAWWAQQQKAELPVPTQGLAKASAVLGSTFLLVRCGQLGFQCFLLPQTCFMGVRISRDVLNYFLNDDLSY